MQISQFHYLPLSPGFFSILVGIFVIVLLLLIRRLALRLSEPRRQPRHRHAAAVRLAGRQLFQHPDGATAGAARAVRPGGRLFRHAVRRCRWSSNWPGT